ncbi:HNH endonuclease family protein [Streptomyces sp. NPDC048611]|uniref:HNH endonuclease family protein n=1 Tax=Streptomyces sp. NPDC048611 TaxID=3155635 RepID=UPI0034372134
MHHTRSLATALTCPLLLLSAVACTPTTSDEDSKQSAAPSSGASDGKGGGLRLADAVGRLKTATESRTGYERTKFHLWIDADHDGCNTRSEVLIAEAVKKPRRGSACRLTGGTWLSTYDGKTLTNARQLDIDHVVPLAEAWDSGASKWSADRREAYANDLGAQRSLIAVSLGSNRSKGDKDPAEWMPPAKNDTCTYAADWVASKLRWKLTADRTEKTKLEQIAAGCPRTMVAYKPAS